MTLQFDERRFYHVAQKLVRNPCYFEYREAPALRLKGMTLLFTTKARFETAFGVNAGILRRISRIPSSFQFDRPVRLKRRHCIPLKLSTWHERHDIGWNNDTKLGQIP